VYHFEFDHDLKKAKHHFEMALKADERILSNIIELYVVTLVEMGRDDEALALLRRFESRIEKDFGSEKAYAICRGAAGLDQNAYNMSSAHRFARIAICLGKESAIHDARNELEKLRENHDKTGLWQYLMWKCLTLSGEKDMADAMLVRLLNPSDKTTFVQFRYLRGMKKQ